MHPEEQRIAIAKACGWTKFTPDTIQYTACRADGKWGMIPDYLNDLNAMAEAFNTLPESTHVTYGRHLQEICNEGLVGYIPCYPEDFAGLARIAHATAAQRAEAFLKTLNFWTE